MRPGGLKSEPATGQGVLTEDSSVCGAVHREDVAQLVVQALFSDAAANKVLVTKVSEIRLRAVPGGGERAGLRCQLMSTAHAEALSICRMMMAAATCASARSDAMPFPACLRACAGAVGSGQVAAHGRADVQRVLAEVVKGAVLLKDSISTVALDCTSGTCCDGGFAT